MARTMPPEQFAVVMTISDLACLVRNSMHDRELEELAERVGLEYERQCPARDVTDEDRARVKAAVDAALGDG